MRRPGLILSALAMTALLAWPFGTTDAAGATPGFPLPIQARFYSGTHMLDDQADGYLFVSSSTSGGDPMDKVLAIETSTGAIYAIGKLSGATGLILEGHRLFVAETYGKAIAVIDTAQSPPAVKRTISTGSYSPFDLAVVGDDIFFTHDCAAAAGVAVVPIDGSSSAQVAGPTGCDGIATSSAIPGSLFVGGPTVVRYDTSSLPLVATATSSQDGYGLTTTADGSHVLAIGYPTGSTVVRDLNPTTLSQLTTYPVPGAGRLVQSPDAGQFFVEGGTTDCYVYRWAVGDPGPANSYRVCATAYAPSQDGSVVYWAGIGQHSLRSDTDWIGEFQTGQDVEGVQIDPPSVSPTVVVYGDRAKLEVSAGTADGGDPLQLWALPDAGSLYRADSKTVGSDGTTVFRPVIHAPAEFYAYHPTSLAYGPIWSNPWQVDVRALVIGNMLKPNGTSGRYALYHRNQRVYCQTVVKPNETGRSFTDTFQFYGANGWRTFGSFTHDLGRHSRFIVYFKRGALPVGRYRFQSTTRSDGPHIWPGTSTFTYWKVTA